MVEFYERCILLLRNLPVVKMSKFPTIIIEISDLYFTESDEHYPPNIAIWVVRTSLDICSP